MCRIAGRLRAGYASIQGVVVEIPAFVYLKSNLWKERHCLVGSLTGVVASKSVTEAPKGALSIVGNDAQSVIV